MKYFFPGLIIGGIVWGLFASAAGLVGVKRYPGSATNTDMITVSGYQVFNFGVESDSRGGCIALKQPGYGGWVSLKAQNDTIVTSVGKCE